MIDLPTAAQREALDQESMKQKRNERRLVICDRAYECAFMACWRHVPRPYQEKGERGQCNSQNIVVEDIPYGAERDDAPPRRRREDHQRFKAYAQRSAEVAVQAVKMAADFADSEEQGDELSFRILTEDICKLGSVLMLRQDNPDVHANLPDIVAAGILQDIAIRALTWQLVLLQREVQSGQEK